MRFLQVQARKAKTEQALSYIQKSRMNIVLFVNATIGFPENLFLVIVSTHVRLSVCLFVLVCVCLSVYTITQKIMVQST